MHSIRTDTGDFWRPRLTAVLDAPPVRAGLYRFRLTTERPAYATLRLILDGRPAAPMTVFLDRIGDCTYAKSFSVPRPVARLELEIEPHLDAAVIVAAELEPLGWRQLLAGRRGGLRHLASPRMLVLKVRQVISGRSGLAFTAAARPDPQAIYEAWQVAFEGEAERRRVAATLPQLRRGGQLKLLMVSRGDESGAVMRMLAAPLDAYGNVAIVPLVIARPGRLVPQALRDLVAVRGGSVREREADSVPLGIVLDAAEQTDAFAFAILDRPGQWSALGAAMLAVELQRHPDCVAAYGDSDRVDGSGRRTQPWFKPAWSPRYQLAADYVRSAVAFRVGAALRELFVREEAVAATSRGLLNLLADAGSNAGTVRHVPRVVFHETDDAEPHPPASAVRRVDAVRTTARPSVSVIMPSRDNPRLLRPAVRTVLDEPLSDLELIVVDNGSKERPQLALLDELSQDARVRVIREPRPFNFSALINRGCAASRGDVVLLLNDDVHAEVPGWLGPLIEVAAEARAGCVGALLLYPSGRIQHGGVVLGTFGVAGHAFRHLAPEAPAAAARLAAVHEVSAVTAACLAVRRKVFDEVGGFDEALLITLNDVDFCLRVRALGYANLMAPHVRLVHHESASRGLDVTPAQSDRLAQESARFLSKWGAEALSDPFYSPHLTLAREDGGPRDI